MTTHMIGLMANANQAVKEVSELSHERDSDVLHILSYYGIIDEVWISNYGELVESKYEPIQLIRPLKIKKSNKR